MRMRYFLFLPELRKSVENYRIKYYWINDNPELMNGNKTLTETKQIASEKIKSARRDQFKKINKLNLSTAEKKDIKKAFPKRVLLREHHWISSR